MIFEEAVPGLLVVAGCSARCGHVSWPSSCCAELGWWDVRAGEWQGAGPHPMGDGHACCLLFYQKQCKHQLCARVLQETIAKKWSLMAETDLSGGAVRSWLWEGAQSHIQPRLQLTMAQKSHGCLDRATAMMLVAGSHPGRCWGGDRESQGHAVPVLVVGNNPGQGHAVWWSIPKPHHSSAVGPEHHPRKVQGGENGG